MSDTYGCVICADNTKNCNIFARGNDFSVLTSAESGAIIGIKK